jgi:hypothetical protein
MGADLCWGVFGLSILWINRDGKMISLFFLRGIRQPGKGGGDPLYVCLTGSIYWAWALTPSDHHVVHSYRFEGLEGADDSAQEIQGRNLHPRIS